MVGRIDEETYLSDINEMSLEELQRQKQRIISDIDKGRLRIGIWRRLGDILSSIASGVIGGIAFGGTSLFVSHGNKRAATVVGGIAGLVSMVGRYLFLHHRNRLETDRINNHFLTHIERVQSSKMRDGVRGQEREGEQGLRAGSGRSYGGEIFPDSPTYSYSSPYPYSSSPSSPQLPYHDSSGKERQYGEGSAEPDHYYQGHSMNDTYHHQNNNAVRDPYTAKGGDYHSHDANSHVDRYRSPDFTSIPHTDIYNTGRL